MSEAECLKTCLVYSITGLNGKIAEAPIGVWFDKDFSRSISPKALERLKEAAEKDIGNVKGYVVFRSQTDQSLRITMQVEVPGRTAFLRATRELASHIKRLLNTEARHQELLTQEMVGQLLA
jgi:hypothetical protein